MRNPLESNGILVINKPLDWTSFDVVKKVRNILQVKKVGHTGTLDPKATGVLILCIGNATKSVDKIMGMDKEYVAEIRLGATSATDDSEGVILENSNAQPSIHTDVRNIVESFIGTIPQMPPAFSAKKIEGQRAYKLARQGKQVKLEPKEVVVHKIEILDYSWPILKLRIQCGKGFYVRSLARDIGDQLGVGGYLTKLERTRVGNYPIEMAISIEQVDASKLISA